MTDHSALLLEAADRLEGCPAHQKVEGSANFFCAICGGWFSHISSLYVHQESCLIVRLRTAAASISDSRAVAWEDGKVVGVNVLSQAYQAADVADKMFIASKVAAIMAVPNPFAAIKGEGSSPAPDTVKG